MGDKNKVLFSGIATLPAMPEPTNQDEYIFYLIGSENAKHKPPNSRKKGFGIHEVGTSTILARFRRADGMVQETIIPHVPTILWDTYKALISGEEKFNEEVFRKCGSAKRVNEFITKNPNIFLYGIHGSKAFELMNKLDIGSMMKDFLRERLLPIFLTGDSVINDLEDIVIRRNLGLEFDCDAHPEMGTFIFTIKILHSFCLKDTTDKITANNMAIYFTPIFIRDPKDTKPKHTISKRKIKRQIDLFTAIISRSQHIVIRSTSSSRNRSNSITHGSSLEAESRRSSSVFGRFMRYVSKNNHPRVSAIAVEKIPYKDCTPEVRQSRSRTRRTPSSSVKEFPQTMPTPQTPTSVSSKLHYEMVATSTSRTPVSHYIKRQSFDKPPKMRAEETVEYLIEARKNIAFTEAEKLPSKPSTPVMQPAQLENLLTSLQESVENMNKAASPTFSGFSTPSNGSFTYKRYDTPSIGKSSPLVPQKCSTPEVVVAELVSSVIEAEKEIVEICEEMKAKNAAIDQLKKETKDQSCSPINIPETIKSPPALQKSSVTYSVRSSWQRSKESKFLEPQVFQPPKIKMDPSKYRTNSGAFDGLSAAKIISSTTQEELEAQIGATNFPLHRPSIALLTKSKQVTKNIARLESSGEGPTKQDEAMRKSSVTFAKPTIASGSKSYSKPPEDFKIPALPKSRSTGSAAIANSDGRPIFQKPALPSKFLAPKPIIKSARVSLSAIKDEPLHGHLCRTSLGGVTRDPAVPSYAASTFASVQHATQRRETTFSSPQHSREVSGEGELIFSQSNNKAPTLASLDDLETLISRLSVSTLDAPDNMH